MNKINYKRLMKELLSLITACSLTLPIAGCNSNNNDNKNKSVDETTTETFNDKSDDSKGFYKKYGHYNKNYENLDLSDEDYYDFLSMEAVVDDYVIDTYSPTDTDDYIPVTCNRVLDSRKSDNGSKLYFVMGALAYAYCDKINSIKFSVIDSDSLKPYCMIVKVNSKKKIKRHYIIKSEDDFDDKFTADAEDNMTEDSKSYIWDGLFFNAVMGNEADCSIESNFLDELEDYKYVPVYIPGKGFVNCTIDGDVYTDDIRFIKKLKK